MLKSKLILINLAACPRSIACSLNLAIGIKKTLRASEQEREDVQKKREAWRQFQQKFPAQKMIFLDETGAKTNMTRLYGRSFKGARCFDHAPDGRWERTTILSALKYDGDTCSVIFDGAINRKMYDAYVEKFLAPILKSGDMVIMDNLNVHKSQAAQEIISKKGASCIFLPQYSPDLNPIEKMWSKIKQLLRGIKARTREELENAIGTALERITQQDALGWFNSCGYR